MTGVLRRRKERIQRYKRKGHVKTHGTTEAEIGVMRPQAKECQEPRKRERGKKDPALETLEGVRPCG